MILQLTLNAHKVRKYGTRASISFLQFVHKTQLLALAPNVQISRKHYLLDQSTFS